MISVDGFTLPSPSSFDVSIMDLSKSDRNANGLLITERVATKRKIELSWKKLTRTELASLLNAVSPTFFSVVYQDPATGANRTGTFYAGDRRSQGMLLENGIVSLWKDISFNMVER